MTELTMLADRWLNRKVVTHPASSLVQDRESSPAETSILTTMLRRQPVTGTQMKLDCTGKKADKSITPDDSNLCSTSVNM